MKKNEKFKKRKRKILKNSKNEKILENVKKKKFEAKNWNKTKKKTKK